MPEAGSGLDGLGMAGPGQLRRIAIAGDGLAAWMAAAAFCRVLNAERCSVVLLGADGSGETAGPFGAADATLPSPQRLHPALELDEDRVLAASGGTFSLGVALSGWNRADDTYFHPFSSLGAPLGPVPFQHVVLKLQHLGTDLRMSNFALAALAAQAGRFARPDGNPASVLSTCRYGLHVDGQRLAVLYRAEAERRGARADPGQLDGVELTPDGALAALRTRDGRSIGADLYVDCSGSEARLLTAMPGAGFLSWAGELPCDRVVSATFAAPGPAQPFSHARAQSDGWLRVLPLQERTALARICSSARVDEEAAVRELKQAAGGARLGELHAHYVRFGRQARIWNRNCVGLGAAAGLIDPIGVSNLQALRAGLDYLLQLLPADGAGTAEPVEFNRRFGAWLDHARDFALAHYRLNGRQGEAFWDACRATALPDSLDYKLRLYQSRGRIALYDEEPLDEVSWINLLNAHGVLPRSYSPIADGYSKHDLAAHVQRIRSLMLEAVGRMPVHAEYLERGGMTARVNTVGSKA